MCLCQPLGITDLIPIRYRPITGLQLVHWHFHWQRSRQKWLMIQRREHLSSRFVSPVHPFSHWEAYGRGVRPENVGQSFTAKGENAFHIAADKEPVHQRPTSWTVAHIINAKCATTAFLESVRVMPEGVWPAQLNVHKTVRGIPFGNLRAPANGDAVDPDAIINQRTGTHRDGSGREDCKFQPWGRDGFQVPRFREEGKDFVTPARKPKLRVEGEFLHRTAVQSFVLMPHARKAHQPRSDSKRTNAPDARSTSFGAQLN
jgi:hypothetical protein